MQYYSKTQQLTRGKSMYKQIKKHIYAEYKALKIVLSFSCLVSLIMITMIFKADDCNIWHRLIVCSFCAIFISFLSVNLIKQKHRIKKFFTELSIESDEDADALLEKSELISNSSFIFLNKDAVIDFSTPELIRIPDIDQVKMLDTYQTDNENNKIPEYKINIRINSHDHSSAEKSLDFLDREERDEAYKKLMKACSQYGSTDDLR